MDVPGETALVKDAPTFTNTCEKPFLARSIVRLAHETRVVRSAAKACGLKRHPRITREGRVHARHINDLFDEVRIFCGKAEKDVFRSCYPLDVLRAENAFWAFIHNVRTCPPEVLEHIRVLLNEEKRTRPPQRENAES